jgi:hypothetical protein
MVIITIPMATVTIVTNKVGDGYFVANQSTIKIDTIMMQKVKPIEKPQSLKINMDGKVC